MTVYVDDLFGWPRRGLWCHMMTDCDVEELHAMAHAIGLKRGWFQDHPLHPHYDLRPSKRILAVKNGAIEVSRQEIVKKCSSYFRTTGCAHFEEPVIQQCSNCNAYPSCEFHR